MTDDEQIERLSHLIESSTSRRKARIAGLDIVEGTQAIREALREAERRVFTCQTEDELESSFIEAVSHLQHALFHWRSACKILEIEGMLE